MMMSIMSTTSRRSARPLLSFATKSRSAAAVSSASFHSSVSLRNDDDKKVVGVTPTKPWADPAMRQYKYWNRENSGDKGKYSFLIEISPESVAREANIISLSSADDAANDSLHTGPLPYGAKLLGVGTSLSDFEHLRNSDSTNTPNVLFLSPSCPHAATVLPLVLAAFPSIEWVHCRSAGIDFIESEAFTDLTSSNNIQVTNAKGQFSSSLAEYVFFACSYFAKDLSRLMDNKKARKYEKFDVQELRGKTLGIVGYGDIGKACAKLAQVYGMRIIALRRHPYLSKNDPTLDVVYGRDKRSLNRLMSESDYIVCSTPSTVETRGMVGAEAFAAVKQDAVFINVGRGPVVDEVALVKALKTGKLKGAALDVFVEEPLPESSELWDLPVLISPHNMDQTTTFMHEATEFFLNENLPRFICGEDLLNPVDPVLGY